MFTVGEFSRIARVSKRLLRYYDQIGLFEPAHSDARTGRRSYRADQLPALNRILALKDLGLSLAEVRRLLDERIGVAALHDLLQQRKTEIERLIENEAQRLRRIEARLEAIRESESGRPLHVVVKPLAGQAVLGVRVTVASFDEGLAVLLRIRAALPEDRQHGLCYCICHAAHESHRTLDLELGCHTSTLHKAALNLPDGLRLLPRLLPAVDAAATTVVRGPLERIILGYGQIGEWAERNGYRTLEGAREVSLHLPVEPGAVDYLTEIQQPVEQLAANNSRKPRRRGNVVA